MSTDLQKREILDRNGVIVKHGDRVRNFNIPLGRQKREGFMRLEDDWWWFYSDEGWNVGCPPHLSEHKDFGIEKL